MGKARKTDRHTRDRWVILDRALQSSRPVSTEELCLAYHRGNVDGLGGIDFRIAGKRYAPVLRKDLLHFKTLLEKADADIEIVAEGIDADDARKKGYRYSNPGFTIIPLADSYLSDADHRRIDEVFRNFEKASSLPHDAVNYIRFEAKGRMEFRFKGKDCPVLFDTNRRLKGREWLPLIYDAIRERRILSIDYVPFGTDPAKPMTWRCHPYLLKEYNNRWFLFCYNEIKHDHYWNLAVDRIASIRMEEGRSELLRPEYSRRFEGMIGVTHAEFIPGQPMKSASTWNSKDIILRIDDARAWGRIISKPVHDTQTVVRDYIEGTIPGRVRISVIPNIEFYMRILSLGEHVTIESPQYIRERMSAIIRNIASQYDDEMK